MRGDSSLNDCDATCYFCLEKGPDESGQPLRRDCSCRGESTGFAHLSCIVKYAKQKSQLIQDWEDHHELEGPWEELTEPWDCCPSCKQQYQNELAVDLADEFVTFVEDRYPGDKKKHIWSRYREVVLYFPLSYFVLVPQSNRLIDTFIIGELTRTLFPKILLYLCSPSKVELLTFTSKS